VRFTLRARCGEIFFFLLDFADFDFADFEDLADADFVDVDFAEVDFALVFAAAGFFALLCPSNPAGSRKDETKTTDRNFLTGVTYRY
jgi:hypothetical protein